MENQEQKKRGLYGKQYLPTYIDELNRILKIKIEPSDLLSIVETDKVVSKNFVKKLKCTYKLFFEEKDKLRDIIFNNIESDKNYYLFVSHFKECGLLIIKSLNEFNWDFSFYDLPSGIITFVSIDFSEELVLDFTEEEGRKYMEIEIYSNEI